MIATDLNALLRVPGRLVLNPATSSRSITILGTRLTGWGVSVNTQSFVAGVDFNFSATDPTVTAANLAAKLASFFSPNVLTVAVQGPVVTVYGAASAFGVPPGGGGAPNQITPTTDTPNTGPAGPFPFGGTSLGLVRDVVAIPGQHASRVREENLGQVVVGGLNLGQAWSLTAIVRAIEEGQAPNWFPTTTGASSGDPGVEVNPVATPPGTWFPTTALLFAPFDELEQDFVYFPAAIAYPEEAARIANSIQREAGLPVAYWATPRSSDGLAVRWKKKEDLVL